MQLIQFTDKGLYVPQAKVYIDPWKPVDHAFITHGHADHSRYGMKKYVATQAAVPVMKHRLGSHNDMLGLSYGEELRVNGVKFSFHPAGHITGSAQIRVEYKGEIWVASGDYKVENDGYCESFEPVHCHTFITESTFGLPVFNWRPQQQVVADINQWWQQNAADGRVSIIAAYSLGKAQRVINSVDASIGRIFTHGAVENVNQVLRAQGVTLADTQRVQQSLKFEDYKGGLVVAPPAAIDGAWSKKFKDFSKGIASGWMAMRGPRRRRSADRGFVLSDHADWDGLLSAIDATGASKVYVTHGYTDIFSRYLCDAGYDAAVVKTEYTGEDLVLENEAN